MGIVINKGAEFKRNDRLYKITRVLEPNRYEAQHIGNELDVCTLTSLDFSQLVGSGEIEFITRGIGGKPIPFRDLTVLPEEEQDEVLHRQMYVVTALNYTRYDQSVKRLESAIEDTTRKLSEMMDDESDQAGKHKKQKQIKAPSVRTLYRWMKAFVASGNNVRSLISNRKKQNRKSSLDSRVDKIINDKIYNYYMRSRLITAKKLYDKILIAVDDHNHSIPENKGEKQLTFPHINTIYNRINKLDAYEVAEKRYGKSYAEQKYRTIGKGEEATRPMEVAQMDHTVLDLFIVDTKTRWPIGRPCVTTMMDLNTRTICGFHVGFDPPSYLSDMCCLYNAFSSKSYVAEKYPGIHNKWPNHGLCERLILDNGKDFASSHFQNTANHLGFTITYAPPREPWKKGTIERSFKTMNVSFINNIPGAVYTEIMDRLEQHKSGYNPQKDAVLDLNDFVEAMHKWIIDDYHQSYHRNLMNTPQKAWEDGTAEYSLIQIPSIHDLRVVLGMTFTRTIQRDGVQFENLYYHNKQLALMREKYKGQKVTIKVDPMDISKIHVYDEALDNYVLIPAAAQKYTQGLSLWQHEVVLRRARENFKKVDIIALARSRQELDQIVQRAWQEPKVSSKVKANRYNNNRQNHAAPDHVSTSGHLHEYMDDGELLNAASTNQPVDFTSEHQPISNSGMMAFDHFPAQDDEPISDCDEHKFNDDHDDDDDELEIFETNFDSVE